jgi:hypothetical protein
MVEWADFPWDQRMYSNADETILTRALATAENCYANAAGGHSRYPGLSPFSLTGLGGSKTYLFQNMDNLIAATDQGRVFRLGQTGLVQDVTGVPISGGNRVIFDATDDGRIVMAAGGPIIQLLGDTTAILSEGAPETTFIQYIQGYLVANIPFTGGWVYSNPGDYTTWNPLNIFTADAKPEPVVAIAVTPYDELMVAGPRHVEQYELLANGNQPFTRRWTTGQGVKYPYTLIADWTGTYGVNDRLEFVRFYGQISQDQSGDVNLTLQNIDNWDEAWTVECSVKGQKHIILCAPNATNVYGTKGITLLLDYINRKWSFLFAWDKTRAQKIGFPIWSVTRCWGRMFAGVPGGVAEFDNDNYTILGATYPFLVRSAHVGKWGPSRMDDVRLRLKRGSQANGKGAVRARIGMRWNLDNIGFDQWQFEDLGTPGEREMTIHWGGQGAADTWQCEIQVTDDVPVEIVEMQVYVERLRW